MSLSKSQMDDFVLGYAQSSTMFLTPQSLVDNIKPSPASMSRRQFGEFINTLVTALNDAGISTNVLVGDMERAVIWDDVSLSLFGHQ